MHSTPPPLSSRQDNLETPAPPPPTSRQDNLETPAPPLLTSRQDNLETPAPPPPTSRQDNLETRAPASETSLPSLNDIPSQRTGSSPPHSCAPTVPEPWSDALTPIATLKTRLEAFADERDWQRFHSPRDLAMALSVEAGEVLELFLWMSEEPGSRPMPARERLEAEVADVAICLLNLCNRTGIDLAGAIARKLEHNAARYPVEKARGSALKYNEYTDR